MLTRMKAWSHPRYVAALLGVTLVVAGCGGGNGATGEKADASTTTAAAAATTTTVAEPIDDDNLADSLLGVEDIGGPWRQVGPIAIGKGQVIGYDTEAPVEMSCDGKQVELPDQSEGFEGMAAVVFTQSWGYPVLLQELGSDEVEKLDANLKAFADIYGSCDKAMLKVDGVEGTARLQQFALPDIGADEVYGFNISTTLEGRTFSSVQILFRKGSVLSALELSSITPPDENTVTNIAALAVDKIVANTQDDTEN